MIKRIELVIQSQNLTPSQFADRIGIQRSGLSHILSGRNNPSLDFVQKVLAAFPELNPSWFLQGKGRMYDNLTESEQGGSSPVFSPEKASFSTQESLFKEEIKAENPNALSPSGHLFRPTEMEPQEAKTESFEGNVPTAVQLGITERNAAEKTLQQPEVQQKMLEKKPKIRRILLFYEDGTFEEYTKR